MRQLVQITKLPNGITVASEKMPGAYSVSLGLWTEVGSAMEPPAVNGVSHFFEHMVFKGTENRTALQIAHQLEERGGNLNAYTTREQTCFYARVVRDDFALALDTVCDLAMNPLLEKIEIEKERKVIIEEIRSYEDSPDELAHDLFSELHFKGQGLAQPITGTAKSVRRVGEAEIRAHHKKILQNYPMFVVAGGNVDHDALVGRVRDLLGSKTSAKSKILHVDPGTGTGVLIKRKEVQQCNVIAGTSIIAKTSGRQRLALSLFNLIFGDGMSSRLFQKVREDHGLAYSIYSAIDNFNGCRSFHIALGTDPKRQQKALDLIRNEILVLLRDGLRANELERAKTAILGGIKLGLDSPSNRMNRLARQVIRTGKFTPFAQVEKELAAIQPKEIMALVEELFLNGIWAAGAVIPKEGPKVDLSPLLGFR
jgi:predicted Zn-dependent peptidase